MPPRREDRASTTIQMDANLFIAEMSERLYAPGLNGRLIFAATATPYNGVTPRPPLSNLANLKTSYGEGGSLPGSCRPPRDLDIWTRTLQGQEILIDIGAGGGYLENRFATFHTHTAW